MQVTQVSMVISHPRAISIAILVHYNERPSRRRAINHKKRWRRVKDTSESPTVRMAFCRKRKKCRAIASSSKMWPYKHYASPQKQHTRCIECLERSSWSANVYHIMRIDRYRATQTVHFCSFLAGLTFAAVPSTTATSPLPTPYSTPRQTFCSAGGQEAFQGCALGFTLAAVPSTTTVSPFSTPYSMPEQAFCCSTGGHADFQGWDLVAGMAIGGVIECRTDRKSVYIIYDEVKVKLRITILKEAIERGP